MFGFIEKMTLHHHHPPSTENSMSAISQLLLARFWPNFKGRFLGHSRTDSNCYSDICARNIYPGNICLYKEYLYYYWPYFNEKSHVRGKANVKLLESKNYLAKVVHSTHITNGKWSCFLAATSSSRSDNVSLVACLLVCLFVTLFFSSQH